MPERHSMLGLTEESRMANRQRPETISTRVLPQEKALVRALAEAEGVSVCEALHRTLMPAVRERLAEVAREGNGAATATR